MNPTYDWVCSACKATNVAGADACQKCGCPALASAADIEHRAHTAVAPPSKAKEGPRLTGVKSVIASLLMVVVVAGIVLERFTVPSMTIWWVALAMMLGGGLSLFAILHPGKTVVEHLRSKSTEAQPGSQQDAAR